MKVILSRKGFDSASGGCPSPILPDGSLLPLPIPDKTSKIRYRDLARNDINLGDVVVRLTRGRVRGDYGAHLDPDLCWSVLPREPGWRPVFGQRGAAQGHLRNMGVGPGDLFLFFGLFRDVTTEGMFVPGSHSRHIVWGWMQVGEVLGVDACRDRLAWAAYHPHLARARDPTNTVYIAANRLSLEGMSLSDSPAAGVIRRPAGVQELTAPGERKVATWRLPAWFHPDGRRSAMTYHARPSVWTRQGDHVLVQAASRGQEFVVDSADYPEVTAWVAPLIC